MSTFLNILSYVVPNVIIALMLVCGVISGTRRGWKKALIKLAYTIVLAVGTFFLGAYVITPALVNALSVGEFIIIVPTLVWMVLFLATMLIAQCIYTIVCHCINKKNKENKGAVAVKNAKTSTIKTNSAKQTKNTTKAELTDEQKKELKERHKKEKKAEKMRIKEAKKADRIAWRKAHKKSRIFGGIIGGVGGIFTSLLLMVMVGQVGVGLTTVSQVAGESIPAFEFVGAIYDHSAYGLLDGVIDTENNLDEQSFEYGFVGLIEDEPEVETPSDTTEEPTTDGTTDSSTSEVKTYEKFDPITYNKVEPVEIKAEINYDTTTIIPME